MPDLQYLDTHLNHPPTCPFQTGLHASPYLLLKAIRITKSTVVTISALCVGNRANAITNLCYIQPNASNFSKHRSRCPHEIRIKAKGFQKAYQWSKEEHLYPANQVDYEATFKYLPLIFTIHQFHAIAIFSKPIKLINLRSPERPLISIIRYYWPLWCPPLRNVKFSPRPNWQPKVLCFFFLQNFQKHSSNLFLESAIFLNVWAYTQYLSSLFKPQY